MRTRTILSGLTVVLLTTAAAGGCQVIAELNTLQVGTGGGAGTGTGSGASCHPGTQCSATCEGSMSAPASPCTAEGTCAVSPTPCPSGFGCADETSCNTTCTSTSQCAKGNVCYPAAPNGGPASECVACGVPHVGGMCSTSCASCEDGTCTTTCGAGTSCAGTGAAPLVVDATTGAAKLTCDSTCSNSTIQCKGLFPCEVDCPPGSGTEPPTCSGMTLLCDLGPCTLTCDMMGCSMVTMNCSDNLCAATYVVPATVQVPVKQENCAEACGCSLTLGDAGAPPGG